MAIGAIAKANAANVMSQSLSARVLRASAAAIAAAMPVVAAAAMAAGAIAHATASAVLAAGRAFRPEANHFCDAELVSEFINMAHDTHRTGPFSWIPAERTSVAQGKRVYVR